ncbi:HAD family phosphatase [Proteiniclasticum sp. QWL-01]|uniref:HAD family hydrolase n=1 Tax=Proteiniclasticum sp. QWL-01 TaxID=3036945 RepID=UPI002200F1D8|nr:HAD family phosphatase [Proteiniclasticum sp. QWL-01]UUM10762.1 HAD family phosphatase [Clostridiaceae bacterium HFYG-1003]WFF72105.1 HAD family phosphatase [Proteiniclasticum sp. QWL-01]
MGRRTGKLPKLIIFDLDGTLLDTEPISIKAWIQAGQEYGVSLKEEQFHPYIGRNAQSIQDLSKDLFGPGFPFEEIYQRKKAICQEHYTRGIPMKPGVQELLGALRDLEIRACVATSSAKVRSEGFLERNDLLRYFEFLISGEEVVHSKPDPEIFNRCLTRAGVKETEAMIVEDSRNGIIGARRSGAQTVLIPDLIRPDEQMREHADLMFDSLFEFRDHILTLAATM